MGSILTSLKSLNDLLEKVPANMDPFFRALSRSAEGKSQKKVDQLCAWASWKANIMIETVRQGAIKMLYEHYKGLTIVSTVANVAQNAVKDPLGTLGSVFGIFAKPAKFVAEAIQVLFVEIPRLAENLASIVTSLPPDPPSPHINFHAFKLKVNTITMQDVLNGPNFPDPKEMFPEPESPAGKKAFEDSFNEKPQEKKPKFSLKDSSFLMSVDDLSKLV